MEKSKSVLLYEYISGGGIKNTQGFEFLIPEGFGMLSSLIKDFTQLGIKTHTLIDNRISSQFVNTHSELINQESLTYTILPLLVDFKEEFFEMLSIVDYVLCIAPEFTNILYNIVKSVEERILPHQSLLNLSAKATQLFTDKLNTESYLHSLGFQAPISYELNLWDPDEMRGNSELVVKPFDGVGASDTYCVSSGVQTDIRKTLQQIKENSPNQRFIIQEKIKGIPLSAFIASRKGKITYFTINFQEINLKKIHDGVKQIEYLGGYTPYTKILPEIKTKIHNLAYRISSDFNLTGFFGIDFIYDTSKPSYSIVDINPRVTTPYIAISDLFRENDSNIIQSVLDGTIPEPIEGKRHFRKSDNNSIILK